MAAWKFAFVGVGLLLGGCMQATLEQAPQTAMKPRDKQLLANAPYNANYPIPEPYLITARKRRGPSSSTPTLAISIWSKRTRRRSATA